MDTKVPHVLDFLLVETAVDPLKLADLLFRALRAYPPAD
jgi:hypothetical protein